MAGSSKLTEEQKAEIIRLREETNLPYAALADMYGVSSMTITRICRPEYYERQKEANLNYQAQNASRINEQRKGQYKYFRTAFHVENDKDVIAFLEKQENVQDYIRQKVKADIQNTREKGSE